MEKIPKHEITTVMGDMNAKIRNDSMDVESMVRTHAMGNINSNVERLLEFCLMNRMVIGGPYFNTKTPKNRHGYHLMV